MAIIFWKEVVPTFPEVAGQVKSDHFVHIGKSLALSQG